MTALAEPHIIRIFTRMRHLYAHRWDSQYGSAMNATGTDLSESAKQWLYDLRDYSAEQVLFGMQKLADKRPEWPPGPIEFMNLCDDVPSVGQIMDRKVDYGPVCAAIRAKIDWYNVDVLTTKDARSVVAARREDILESLRHTGRLKSINAQRFEALEQK